VGDELDIISDAGSGRFVEGLTVAGSSSRSIFHTLSSNK
jgi:hypothetical protein